MDSKPLIPFDSLGIGAWFVFPQQIDRLHAGDCENLTASYPGDPVDRQLAFSVKVRHDAFQSADRIQDRNALPIATYGGPGALVLEVRMPQFIWLPMWQDSDN
jgi:hypothetical protein